MSQIDLHEVAASVIGRAQRQGYVVPREIREELSRAGALATQWKDVLTLARPALQFRRGRYYHVPPSLARLRERVRQEQEQTREMSRRLRELVKEYKAAAIPYERRKFHRVPFIQTVTAETTTSEHRLLSQDISLSGIRLVGNCNLAGQKVKLFFNRPANPEERIGFIVHVLWGQEIADGIIEQGGVFLAASSTG